MKTRATGAIKIAKNARLDEEGFGFSSIASSVTPKELKEYTRKKEILEEFPVLVRKKRRVDDGES